jgi:low affinity Fe/Cu permease
MERTSLQRRLSRILHAVGDVTSRAAAAAMVLLVLAVFATVLAVNNFPGNWQVGFSTAVSAVTLVMLFVVQHTQSRHQAVLQMKLDELIKASPEADDLLVHLEAADDGELLDIQQGQLAHHESVRGADALEVIEYVTGDRD